MLQGICSVNQKQLFEKGIKINSPFLLLSKNNEKLFQYFHKKFYFVGLANRKKTKKHGIYVRISYNF